MISNLGTGLLRLLNGMAQAIDMTHLASKLWTCLAI